MNRFDPGSLTSTVPRTGVTFADWPPVGGGGRKVALTFRGPLTSRVHVLAPLHAPPQPPNVQPGSGFATSVTALPSAKRAVHVVPQSMPAGVLVTLPSPVFETVTGLGGGSSASKRVMVRRVTLWPTSICPFHCWLSVASKGVSASKSPSALLKTVPWSPSGIPFAPTIAGL